MKFVNHLPFLGFLMIASIMDYALAACETEADAVLACGQTNNCGGPTCDLPTFLAENGGLAQCTSCDCLETACADFATCCSPCAQRLGNLLTCAGQNVGVSCDLNCGGSGGGPPPTTTSGAVCNAAITALAISVAAAAGEVLVN